MNVPWRSILLLAFGATLGAAMAHQEPPIKPVIEAKLANIVVTTTSMSKEVDFYQETLGLKSFFRNKTSCFLKAGSVNLVFVFTTDKAKITKNLCLDFGVKDLPASLAALTKAGIKVNNSDPAILQFTDPDGNLVEVVHG